MTDDELQMYLKRMVEGDTFAFEQVYQQTLDDVYKTVSYLVFNKQETLDIVHEVYIQLWKSIPTYDANRPFSFWLHGLIVRQVQDWRRKFWRRLRISNLHKQLESEKYTLTDENIVQQETHSELISYVEKLSYKLRVVIILRYFHHYTLEEISELLGIPVGTVKSRHHLALKELRKQYLSIEGSETSHVFGR